MVSVKGNCFLILFAALSQGITALNGNSTTKDHLALAEFTVRLVKVHFSKFTSTVVVKELRATSHWNQVNAEVLDHILFNLQDTMSVELYFGKTEKQLWEYYIIVIDNEKALFNIQSSLPASCYDIKFHFLIVLTEYSSRYIQVLRYIFKFYFHLGVLHVKVVLNHPVYGISMYTYSLFTNKMCRKIQPIPYFRLSEGFENLQHAYPQKMLNLHGCPIRVCVELNPPMTSFSERQQKHGTSWSKLQGIDVDFIDIIAHGLNFSIKLLPIHTGGSYVGRFHADRCSEMLRNGSADIAIGGFSASDPKRCDLSYSFIYHHSPVVFAVLGGRQRNSFFRLGRPFQRDLWQNMAIFLAACTLSIYVLRAVRPSIRNFLIGENNRDPIMNFYAILLGYSIRQLPRRNFARYCLMLWLLMSLVLRNAYQGSLYDSIRMDKFNQVPTAYKDLHNWNYKIFISEVFDYLHMFPRSDTIVLKGDPFYRLQVLEATPKGRYAAVVIKDHFIEYNRRRRSRLQIVNERVYVSMNAMLFSKHSIFREVFDKKIGQIYWTGLTGYIVQRNVKKFENQNQRDTKKKISFDRLSGLFEIYGIMMGLAVMVFVLELMSISRRALRNILDWIN